MARQLSFNKQDPYIIKSRNDFVVNNDSILSSPDNDTELKFDIVAGKTYFAKIILFWNSATDADMKTDFNNVGLSGSVGITRWSLMRKSINALWKEMFSNQAHASDGVEETNVYIAIMRPTINTSPVLRFAQNTARVSNSTLFAGSFIMVWES